MYITFYITFPCIKKSRNYRRRNIPENNDRNITLLDDKIDIKKMFKNQFLQTKRQSMEVVAEFYPV